MSLMRKPSSTFTDATMKNFSNKILFTNKVTSLSHRKFYTPKNYQKIN